MANLLKKVFKNQKGMTLLEVMIALTILLLGILMLTGMQFATINANANGFNMSAAVSLGETLMERLKLQSSTSVDLTAGVHNDPITIPNPGGVTYFPATVNGVTYNGTYTVTDNNPIFGIKRIDLTVTWTDSRAHSITLTGRVGM